MGTHKKITYVNLIPPLQSFLITSLMKKNPRIPKIMGIQEVPPIKPVLIPVIRI